MATYKGIYKVKNIDKYEGDYKNVVYRSSWEKAVFKWVDMNSQILKWSSESVIIPYYNPIDKKVHRYFVDLKLVLEKQTFLVEIKPKSQTLPPVKPKRQTRRYISESMTYVQNQSKWQYANEYCEQRGWLFEVWTEDKIRNLGIKLI